jgi:RimJ/RimL family protein N-acetyltransferase
MTVAIRLRPFVENDFSAIRTSIENASELLQWAGPGLRWPLDVAQLRTFTDTERRKEGFLAFSAVSENTGIVVGHAQLVVDRAQNSATVARVLIVKQSRGQGFGTALARAIVRLGLDDLQLHRLTLNVFDFNTAAIRCYERAGFVKEGLLRDARRANDGYWNLCVMGLLESDALLRDNRAAAPPANIPDLIS